MPEEARAAPFSREPLLWLAAAFALGIVTAEIINVPVSAFLAVSVCFSFLAAFLRNSKAGTALILAAFVALGGFCYSIQQASVSDDRLKTMFDDGRLVSGDPLEVEGSLTGSPEPAPSGLFLFLNADRISISGTDQYVSGRIRFFLTIDSEASRADYERLDLQHGTRLRIACRPERDEQFLNPGVLSRKLLLDRQGIDATATVKSPLLIEKLGRDLVFIPLAFVYEQRVKIIDEIKQQFSPKAAGILIASMLGDQYFLDRSTADVFREGGTFHVLVISGLHITFIGGVIFWLAGFASTNKLLRAVVSITVLWIYGIAVGGEPPVIRACIMFTFVLSGYALYKKATLLNIFGGSVLALLVFRPSDLFDPSFQLTFVSVLAIIATGLPLISKLRSIGTWTPTPGRPFPPNVPSYQLIICEMVYWNEAAWQIERSRQIWSSKLFKSHTAGLSERLRLRRLASFIFDGLVISISVQIWLLPMLVYYFHRVSFASVLLNLWVGPILVVESISALVAVFVARVSSILAIPFVTLTEILNWLLVNVPAVLTDAGLLSFRLPVYSGLMQLIYFLYFVPVILLSFAVARWNPFSLRRDTGKPIFHNYALPAGFLTLLFGGAIIFHPFSAPLPTGRLQVDFLDVGQGDSALITLPNGETILVDAGGQISFRRTSESDDGFEPDVPRIGERVVSEFLWERGLSRIDRIIATHPDADHMQGLEDVARNFTIGNAYLGRIRPDDPESVALLSVLSDRSVPVSELTVGFRLVSGNVVITVLHPQPAGSIPPMSANNESVVLRIDYGEASFLLAGDIEREAEDLLVQSGTDLNADVLKVPHHGSRTSSTQEFVTAVRPRFAIISVGRRSRFGHPHAEVVERWQAAGAQVLTTGEKGMISVSTDGKDLKIDKFY